MPPLPGPWSSDQDKGNSEFLFPNTLICTESFLKPSQKVANMKGRFYSLGTKSRGNWCLLDMHFMDSLQLLSYQSTNTVVQSKTLIFMISSIQWTRAKPLKYSMADLSIIIIVLFETKIMHTVAFSGRKMITCQEVCCHNYSYWEFILKLRTIFGVPPTFLF